MAEVKGKFIMLAGSLMTLYKDGLAEANKGLMAKTGKTFAELDPEGWYDTSLFNLFMETYARYSVSGDRAIVTLGRNVYPTIKKSAGLPPHLKTPLDFIKFEADGFLANHAGGILGGISSGQTIRVAIALKPTASITTPGKTINIDRQDTDVLTKGRHDPCVGVRATPIAEAMLAIVLMDHFLRDRAQNADVIPPFQPIES